MVSIEDVRTGCTDESIVLTDHLLIGE